MNVDLPAPLSPRTHVTSPAPTPTETSFSATTLPKYFEMLRTSSSAVPFAVAGGCLLTGGFGSAVGAAMGALIIGMTFIGIQFSGWNTDWRFLFLGVILLAAVLVNTYVRRRAEGAGG